MTNEIITSLETYRKQLVQDLEENKAVRSNVKSSEEEVKRANKAINSIHIQIAIVDERLIKLNKEDK